MKIISIWYKVARIYTENKKYRDSDDPEEFIDIITRKEGFKALNSIEGNL